MDTQATNMIMATTSVTGTYTVLVVGIMIIAGIVGGLVNYLLTGIQEQPAGKAILKHSFLGMATALTVPFFLNMISSNILDVAQTKPLNLLVFAGFCLIFSTLSCRFLQHVYGKKLRKTGVIVEDNQDIKDDTVTAKKTKMTVSKDTPPKEGLSSNDLKILSLLLIDGNYISRGFEDLMKQSNISLEGLNESLSLLMAKGLVGQKLTDGDKLLFSMTPRGQKIYDKVLDKNKSS
jgi:predicted transcriptional regulator